MPRLAIVPAETVRRNMDEPSDTDPAGTWVDFKTRLSYGDHLELQASALTLTPGQAIAVATDQSDAGQFNMATAAIMRLAQWVVDWNLVDINGQTVRLPSSATLRVPFIAALDQSVASWIGEQVASLEADVSETAAAEPDVLGNGRAGGEPATARRRR